MERLTDATHSVLWFSRACRGNRLIVTNMMWIRFETASGGALSMHLPDIIQSEAEAEIGVYGTNTQPIAEPFEHLNCNTPGGRTLER